jgi:hypothetical protein
MLVSSPPFEDNDDRLAAAGLTTWTSTRELSGLGAIGLIKGQNHIKLNLLI